MTRPSNSPPIISNAKARNLVLSLQGLCDPPGKAIGLDGFRDLITRMGFVQVDSIQWVERAHHMILFARNQTYRPKHLRLLAERERALFEHWTHDSSFIPVEFHPFWQHKYRRNEARIREKFIRWQGPGFLDQVEALFERIDREGVLLSRDVERKPQNGPAEMWQWHDGKAALEYLWRTGRLAIAARQNGFQKLYDRLDRVIPAQWICDIDNNSAHDEAAFIDWACRSALSRLGFGTPKDIAHFWELLTLEEVKAWCEAQKGEDILEVSVECTQTNHEKGNLRPMLALASTLAHLEQLPEPPGRIRVLSPFDPVVRDRKRLSWLFGFDYTIEIYVPAAKRKYGYYVFPLLQGNRLIGRIDLKAERKEDTLVVRRFWLEKGVRWSTRKRHLLEAELTRLCRLCGVSGVKWEEERPA